jgi:hypothetical protein
MCSGTCTTEEKVFQQKNVRFLLLQVFDLMFRNIFILKQCMNPNLYANPNQNFCSDSESDPAKTYRFFRIRIHNKAFSKNVGSPLNFSSDNQG